MTTPAASDPRVDDLPDSIRQIGRNLGYAAAALLVHNYPGTRMRVPKTMPADDQHPMRILGEVGAALIALCPDETIEIPVSLITLAARRRRVREMAARYPTPTLNEIALATGLTRRSVLRILKDPIDDATVRPARGPRARDDRQIDLIDWLQGPSGDGVPTR